MGANKSIGQKDSVTVTVRRGVMVSAMIISLCFVIVGYFILSPRDPFHGGWRIVTTRDYLMGSVCILFFGFCFIASIIRLKKPKAIMQISNDGLVVPRSGKGQSLIAWEDIWEVERVDQNLYFWLENPALFPADSTAPPEAFVNVSVRSINYNVDEIEELIRSKLTPPSELSYKGYLGSVEFSSVDDIFHGNIVGINDHITYEGDSVHSLRLDFMAAVDEYMESGAK